MQILLKSNYYRYYSFRVFLHQLWLRVFHWVLSDSKSPHVSRILLSILADRNNAVVWMVPACTPIPIPLQSLLGSFRAHQLKFISLFLSGSIVFQFSGKVQVLVSLFVFFNFFFVVCRNSKVHRSIGSLFLLTITRSGCLVEIR